MSCYICIINRMRLSLDNLFKFGSPFVSFSYPRQNSPIYWWILTQYFHVLCKYFNSFAFLILNNRKWGLHLLDPQHLVPEVLLFKSQLSLLSLAFFFHFEFQQLHLDILFGAFSLLDEFILLLGICICFGKPFQELFHFRFLKGARVVCIELFKQTHKESIVRCKTHHIRSK